MPELFRIRMSQSVCCAKEPHFHTLKGHREVQGKTFEILLKGMGRNLILRHWLSSELHLIEDSEPARNIKALMIESQTLSERWNLALTTCYQWVLMPEISRLINSRESFWLSALFLFHKPPTAELHNFLLSNHGKNNIGKYRFSECGFRWRSRRGNYT